MTKRVLIVVAVAVVAAVAAAYALRPETGIPENAPTEDEMAAAIGSEVMTNLWRGHVPDRSGELMLVPKPHNFLLGEWDLTTLGTDDPLMSTSHPNPWDYLARVPIIVHGPPYIHENVVSDAQVDITDLPHLYDALLPGRNVESNRRLRLGDALDADFEPYVEPKVIFTVVIDGGGWNTLQQHPDAWPFIDSLRDTSTTFTNATIGSAPSITGALHANVGTGLYPFQHGIPGNQMRGADGKNTDAWLQNADPRYLDEPTMSELWDELNDNEPIVATVSYEGWHLGMIGHGSQREGGDKDIAVLWETGEEEEPVNEWWVNEEYYELPSYLQETDLATLERYEEQLDPRDGLVDGTWYGKTLEELRSPLTRPGTPAFVRFTGDAVIDVMRNEGIGRDAMTDMFWVEMKMPDFAGHAWNVLGAEQEDVLRETDRQSQRMKRELDRRVGKGNYVFAITADHGQQPLPDLYGGWRINNKELQRDIIERFGDVVEKVTPVDVYFDADALEESDVEISDVARFIGTYTIGDNIRDGAPGADRVPEARLDETLFAGAFSTEWFQSTDPGELSELGDGDYPEGDLFVDFEVSADS